MQVAVAAPGEAGIAARPQQGPLARQFGRGQIDHQFDPLVIEPVRQVAQQVSVRSDGELQRAPSAFRPQRGTCMKAGDGAA